MKLSFDDAVYISGIYNDYFSGFHRIDEYMKEQKMESLESISHNPLFPPEDDLFSDFTMNPRDMDLDLVEMPTKEWETLLMITSSHINIPPVGRNIKFAVKEKNTGKYIGFIRMGSPVINCKPRNDMLKSVFSQDYEKAKRFNKSSMMGFVIVPAQPFGYNYLGGKLLAAICCSHEVRKIVNEKYDMNLCLFETTSLYGNTKSSSQYDGMKPYLKYKGLTDSDFVPMMHGKIYENLIEYVENRVGKLIEKTASSKKLKISQKIIGLVKSELKGTSEYDKFVGIIENAKNLMEQKRYYVSNYGFSNVIEYVNCETDTLIPGENFDKFYLENIFSWWKNKSENRYNNLIYEGRLRKELEIWTSGKHIDVIR